MLRYVSSFVTAAYTKVGRSDEGLARLASGAFYGVIKQLINNDFDGFLN
jgi:hypothetical protein